jgi:hypothetical protein
MVTSSSKGSARADDEKPVWQRVLEIIKAKGEADVAAVVEVLEKEGYPFGDSPQRQVAGVFHGQLRVKGLIEKVEGRFGWWKATGT